MNVRSELQNFGMRVVTCVLIDIFPSDMYLNLICMSVDCELDHKKYDTSKNTNKRASQTIKE